MKWGGVRLNEKKRKKKKKEERDEVFLTRASRAAAHLLNQTPNSSAIASAS